METITSVLVSIKEEDLMFSIDLKDAYFPDPNSSGIKTLNLTVRSIR